MHFITQNALAYFSYPSITTKRFIHSLGCMHLSSFMFKNALLNSHKSCKNTFLENSKNILSDLAKENNLNIDFSKFKYFNNKALYQFTIPTKNKNHRRTYVTLLQTLRIVGLIHDLGHLPFSHQVEHALKNVYEQIIQKDSTHLLNNEEIFFKNFYELITNNSEEVLHEAIGKELINLIFDHELSSLINKPEELEYIKLIKILAIHILEEKTYKGYDFKILHDFINGTVDSDRLDYVNRDMLASGYITGPVDFIRITKQAILVERNDNEFVLAFGHNSLIDIEHMLEMRFNLYKKVIYSYGIAKSDALLENVVQYLSAKYFKNNKININLSNSISMLWKFQSTNTDKYLDNICMLDENWLISFFKDQYFKIKNKTLKNKEDMKYLYSFEEVLFGRNNFKTPWVNLNEFYEILNFTKIERYKFRESFGYITPNQLKILQNKLNGFINKWEKLNKNCFFTYKTVSFHTGISKEFYFYDGNQLINIDEFSTLRKRLKHSIRNTVPFYLYTTEKVLSKQMKKELKNILLETFN